MDHTILLPPSNELGLPAPYNLLITFKVLGFILHVIPMSLFSTGILLAMIFRKSHDAHARLLSERLMKQMPVIIAYGINLGIIPLLFIQVLYYKVFYPATILMAWPWLAVIILLIFSYYGIYIYATGLKRKLQGQPMSLLYTTSGWIAAFLFIMIGFLFTNSMSLMTNVPAWSSIQEMSNVNGAVLGIGLNTADPTLWPRWLMMLGLTSMVTAVYIIIDAEFFTRDVSDTYRKWAIRFSSKMYSMGMLIFSIMGTGYVFLTWKPFVRQAMFQRPLFILTMATALSPGITWLILLAGKNSPSRRGAIFAGFAQLTVIILNAISRQIVQNLELMPYFDPTTQTVHTQWGPLIIFLILLGGGVGVTLWMIRKIVAVKQQRTLRSIN